MSDGVTEARSRSGDELDLEVVATEVRRHRGHDMTVLADAIVDAVRRHRDDDQAQDDVTVFAVRRTP